MELADFLEKQTFNLTERHETAFCVENTKGEENWYIWMEQEETNFCPVHSMSNYAILKYEAEGKLPKYRLYVEDEQKGFFVFTLNLPTNSKQIVSCELTQGKVTPGTISQSMVKRAFFDWFQELPEYRLRFVTGEWKVEENE